MYKCTYFADEQDNRCSIETSAHCSELKIKHIKHCHCVPIISDCIQLPVCCMQVT